jgi:polysaccharide biosynthesis protein PslH
VADTIVHAGALSYSANLDAMGYFLADIFPGVRAAADRVLLRVTGTAPPAALAALPRSPGVEFTGYLADVRPTIAQSWASVVPLRRGGGTRLKILESMALGTPVVATPKGAEGLDVADGQELLIGADPGAFARAVIALLQSPDLRARLARAGRRRVETTYNWREVGRDLCPLVEGMEPGRTPRTRRALPEPAIPAAGSVARGER